jgi:uncharacterized C2H2 Zn-finger protein
MLMMKQMENNMSQENVDYVECKVCGFKGMMLNRHLAKHGITADEYRQKFPDARVACESVMQRQGESVAQTWQEKPKVEKPKEEHVCPHCGGKFNHLCNFTRHMEREKNCYLNGQNGKDFVTCGICGMRSDNLEPHIRVVHSMSVPVYQQTYGEQTVAENMRQRMSNAQIGKHSKLVSDRRGSRCCRMCGDWFVFGGEERHLQECILKHPDKYVEGKDYVRCPECGKVLLRLGRHLSKEHGWDKGRLMKAVNEGLQITASGVSDRWLQGRDQEAIKAKREQTTLERYGVTNAFASPEKQAKIRQTNQERYGVDHPMQNSEVRTKQFNSAQNGPSGQELFFMEHVISPNVIYTGYGGRFIRTKTGVKKYGREIKDLNPDFMVLPDNVLESATSASKERRPLDRLKHRTKYVIELLGDWYHSEQVIGIPATEHEKQIIDAYKSAGIECLVLWEHDVLNRWNEIEPAVNAWIQKAVADINANPVWKKATKNKVDGRTATFVCPYGSGRKFKTVEQLEEWKVDPLNFWRPEMVEGRDYVRCLECENVRVGKVAEHIRKMYGGMTKEQYLERHPGAVLVAERVSEVLSQIRMGREGMVYVPRVAYRLPDGSVVRKADAWMRAWNGNPPADSKVKAASVDLDPWTGKTEGEDFVTCNLCGYRAENLSRHVKREHSLEGYAGPLKSRKCETALREASKKSWDARGRKNSSEASIMIGTQGDDA